MGCNADKRRRRIGALLGGLHISLLLVGSRLIYKRFRVYGELCTRRLQQGFYGGLRSWGTPAPRVSARGNWEDPHLQEVDEAPDSWEQHLSPCSLSSEILEGLTEKVGTLGLWAARKNCFGAAKKQARRVKVAGPLAGNSVIGQCQPTQEGQKQALQKPSTYGT